MMILFSKKINKNKLKIMSQKFEIWAKFSNFQNKKNLKFLFKILMKYEEM